MYNYESIEMKVSGDGINIYINGLQYPWFVECEAVEMRIPTPDDKYLHLTNRGRSFFVIQEPEFVKIIDNGCDEEGNDITLYLGEKYKKSERR